MTHRPAPTFETLPTEIYLRILEELRPLYPPRKINAANSATADINALAAVSRSLYTIFNPILYQHAARCEPGLLFWACRFGLAGIVDKLLKLGVSPNRALVMQRMKKTAVGYPIPLDYNSDEPQTALKAFHTRFRGIPFYNPISTPWEEGELYPERFKLGGNCGQGMAHEQHELWVSGETWLATTHLKSEAEVREFCEKALVNYTRPFCFPIHFAVLGGHSAIINTLVGSGSYIDSPSHYLCGAGFCKQMCPPRFTTRPKATLWTPLHFAICHSKYDSRSKVVKLLLAHHGQAPVDTAYNHIGISPLHWAAATGNLDLIDDLLRLGQDIHATDSLDLSPLWYACLNRRLDAIRLLMAKGADIDDDSAWGFTPLVYACTAGEPAFAQELICLGADIHVECFAMPTHYPEWSNLKPFRKGLRPLDFAVLPRWVACPKNYATSKESVSLEDRNRQCSERLALVRKLLSAGASTDASPGNVLGPSSQFTPLIFASFYHQLEVMKCLLAHMDQKRNGSINARITSGEGALHAVLGMIPKSARLPGVFFRVGEVPEKQELLEKDCISLLKDFGIDPVAQEVASYGPIRLTPAKGPVSNTVTAPEAGGSRRRRRHWRTTDTETHGAALMRSFGNRDTKTCRFLVTKRRRIQNGERFGDKEDEFRDMFCLLAREFDAESQSDLAAFTFLCDFDRNQRIGVDPDLFLDALTGQSDDFWAIMLDRYKDHLRQMVDFPLKCSSHLHTALTHRDLTVARLTCLLEHGIDPDVPDEDDIPPITVAVEHLSLGHVKTFVNFSAHVHIVDRHEVNEGWDSLSNLFKSARECRLQDFVWFGPAFFSGETANPILTTICFSFVAVRPPFHTGQIKYAILEAILKAQPLTHKIPARLHFEYLREACRLLDVQALTLLLEYGTDCNAPARKGTGHTVLWWLLHHRDDILKFPFGKPITSKPYTTNSEIVSAGDWMGMRRPFGRMEWETERTSWLQARMAILDCWVECVELLLWAGADTRLKTESGKTIAGYFNEVLFYKGNKRMLARLREAVRAKVDGGCWPLSIADPYL